MNVCNKVLAYALILYHIGLVRTTNAQSSFERGKNLYYQKKYAEAIPYLEEAAKLNLDTEQKKEIIWLLGASYYDIDIPKAIQYFEQCYNLDPDYKPLALYYAGTLKITRNQFREAISTLETFLSAYMARVANPDPQVLKAAQDAIEQARYGLKMKENPIKVKIENLGKVLNSEENDTHPVFTADESILYFTSQRKNGTSDRKTPNGEFYEDIWFSEKVNGEWTTPRNVGPPLNTIGHDFVLALSADGQTMYLYNSTYNGGDIFVSYLMGNVWTKPRPLPSAINSSYWDAQACISADGNIIIFASERPGGYGGRDLYWSKRKPNGEWEPAKNLGPVINSPLDEASPFLHADGKTLYFSSQRNTMGGLDIFKSTLQEDGTWSTPINLGYPINSGGDDTFFVINPAGTVGYFSSTREDPNAVGKRDMYRILFEKAEGDKVITLSGYIKDKETNEPLDADIVLEDNEKNQIIAQFKSNPTTGKYVVVLPAGKNYGISVRKSGYLFHSENFTIQKEGNSEKIELDILLQRVKTGAKVTLNNIFFKPNTAEIDAKSKAELALVAKFLQDNPNTRIQVNGHTDGGAEGTTDEYLQQLSEKRANAVREYLIKHYNIKPERIIAKGFGRTQPIGDNKTEEGRRKNRRTEFEIIQN
ncbi:MAG: OmpA family protein [Bacteroidia bacterium]|nr:OmpA family protein [Bacteroidia bacterium]